MKKYFFSVLIIAVISACNSFDNLKEVSFQGTAQGTYYMLKYYDVEGRNFQPEIDSILKDFDQSVSLWVENSTISKVNRNENIELDKYFIDNLKLSQKISVETQGAFDCTLDPLIEAWGFGFRQKIKLTQHMVDSIKEFVGYNKIRLRGKHLVKDDPRIEVNFNAIAQGYSVDVLGTFLESREIENYLIDVGGEILSKGIKPENKKWVVGIQKPTEDASGEIEAQVTVELIDKALVTSGSYRKYYEENGRRYSHMIDPSTGFPVTHGLLSVTVLANTAAEADGYATAFMIMGLDKAFEFVNSRDDLEAYFIYADENKIMRSACTKGLNKLILNN